MNGDRREARPVSRYTPGGSVSRRTWLYAKSDRCGICGQPVATPEEATVDHIVPLSRGGLKNHRNEQLAHQLCNRVKGNLLPEEVVGLASDLAGRHHHTGRRIGTSRP